MPTGSDGLSVGVIGGSGYTGGELARLLLGHPTFDLQAVTSRKQEGRSLSKVHPNLRGETELKFVHPDELKNRTSSLDLLFLGVPHGQSMRLIEDFLPISDKVVDLSADFRLSTADAYEKWYGEEHICPALLDEFVYGLPEIHRGEIKGADLVASPGCTATSAIIPLEPLVNKLSVDVEVAVVDAKVGSSAGGAQVNPGSHHPERAGVVRPYKPWGHRHTAEMQQELGMKVGFTPHAVEMVRGILTTVHIYLNGSYSESDIWKALLNRYKDEPFIQFVNEKRGIYRQPEPKLLMGTNYFAIGFTKDQETGRLVVITALDNLVKGAAGQAIQAANLMSGLDETAGLTQIGLHPV